MVAEHLAVVGHEDHHGVVALAGARERLQHAPHLLVDQLDHAVVGRLLPPLLVSRRPRVLLEERAAQPFLRIGVALAVDGGRQVLVQVALLIGEGSVERPVRVEDIDAHQPRAAALLLHEFDGAVGAPGGLVQLGRDVGAVAGAAVARGVYPAGVDRLVQAADAAQPVGVGVAAADELQRRQAEVEHPVAVVHARLHPGPAGGDVQLAGQSAVVAAVGDAARDQPPALVGRKVGVAVAVDVNGVGVQAGEEAGAARLTHRALAVRAGERNPLGAQPVDDRCVDVRIVQAVDGVVALLVGADPQDVGELACHAADSRWYRTRPPAFPRRARRIDHPPQNDPNDPAKLEPGPALIA